MTLQPMLENYLPLEKMSLDLYEVRTTAPEEFNDNWFTTAEFITKIRNC
jgi:hypothetical protein